MLNEDYDFLCPYCGSVNALMADQLLESRILQDCEVCCRPITITVRTQGGKVVEIDVRQENE
jgi:hypothetical protein